MQQLRAFAIAYQWYVEFHGGRAPGGLDELAACPEAAETLRECPAVVAQIRASELAVVWRAEIAAAGPGADDCLLAYEAECHSRGGWVVRWGGRVEQVTTDEFNRASRLPARPGG